MQEVSIWSMGGEIVLADRQNRQPKQNLHMYIDEKL
jgi:hypothetical protein